MALQPLDRPQGSSHILRFNGPVIVNGATLTTYPKENGTFATARIAATNLVVARFLMGDTTDLTNSERTLPVGSAFDATTPAGVQPAVAVLSGVAASANNILNATDLDITARTWCDNTYVTVRVNDAVSALKLLAFNPLQTRVCIDSGASSGLGLNTGFPVVCIALDLGKPQVPETFLSLDVLIEVRDSSRR